MEKRSFQKKDQTKTSGDTSLNNQLVPESKVRDRMLYPTPLCPTSARWLSEISRKKQAEGATADKGDEDGPPSDSEEEKAENGEAKEKKDEDSTDIETSSESSREPVVSKAEPSKPEPTFEGYFEKQRQARCAIHALNNALGRPFCTDDDMEHAVDQLMSVASHEGLLGERRTLHAREGGWYSSEAIANAVTTVSMRKAGRVEYILSLEPLYESPQTIHNCAGAVVQEGGVH